MNNKIERRNILGDTCRVITEFTNLPNQNLKDNPKLIDFVNYVLEEYHKIREEIENEK